MVLERGPRLAPRGRCAAPRHGTVAGVVPHASAARAWSWSSLSYAVAKGVGCRRDAAEPTDVAHMDDTGQECRGIGSTEPWNHIGGPVAAVRPLACRSDAEGRRMPRISSFYGIVIAKFCNDHPPAHFTPRTPEMRSG